MFKIHDSFKCIFNIDDITWKHIISSALGDSPFNHNVMTWYDYFMKDSQYLYLSMSNCPKYVGPSNDRYGVSMVNYSISLYLNKPLSLILRDMMRGDLESLKHSYSFPFLANQISDCTFINDGRIRSALHKCMKEGLFKNTFSYLELPIKIKVSIVTGKPSFKFSQYLVDEAYVNKYSDIAQHKYTKMYVHIDYAQLYVNNNILQFYTNDNNMHSDRLLLPETFFNLYGYNNKPSFYIAENNDILEDNDMHIVYDIIMRTGMFYNIKNVNSDYSINHHIIESPFNVQNIISNLYKEISDVHNVTVKINDFIHNNSKFPMEISPYLKALSLPIYNYTGNLKKDTPGKLSNMLYDVFILKADHIRKIKAMLKDISHSDAYSLIKYMSNLTNN